MGVFLLENGTADPYYQRFVSPKQSALILGNSKAALGLIPGILNDKLGLEYGTEIYNYSFSLFSSPYGPSYTHSIKDKLLLNKEQSYFIVTVDPWSVSSFSQSPNKPEAFVENRDFISNVFYENDILNFRYLLFWFKKSYYEVLLMRMKRNFTILHNDGWLESNVKMDNVSVQNRNKNNERFYCRNLSTHSISDVRILYLMELLNYLKMLGDVYLVRMPINKNLLSIDNTFDPEFNDRMRLISSKLQINYYDFNSYQGTFEFMDGVHLSVNSAELLTKMVRDSILLVKKKHEQN